MNRRALRVAVVTTLYPNSRQTHHGVFVEERLRQLVNSGVVQARVIAPVPWFPSRHPRFGRYAEMAAVPAHETRYGVSIAHPRYVVIPRIGMTWAPRTLAQAMIRALERLRAKGFDFDLIDAHYLYPDGVAGAIAARRFNRPLVITARGTDVNLIAGMARAQRQIRWAIDRADALITVSRALGDRLAETVGIDRARIATLGNGVDLDRFRPGDRQTQRARFGWTGPVWICVGRLIEAKGMHIAIDALSCVPDATLVLIGEGADEPALRARAARLGVAGRVHFAGSVAHDRLPDYFTGADVLMHAADREGMPNVLLEALACGCAVVATAVGGIPEIMSGPPAGRLMSSRSADAMRDCWEALTAGDELGEDARQARRVYAEQFGWESTTRGQLRIFSRLTGIEIDHEPVGGLSSAS